MTVTIKPSSWDGSINSRVSANETDLNSSSSGGNGLKARVETLEGAHDGSQSYLGAALNTSLVSILAGDLNTTNTKVNAIQSAIEAHGITAAS